MSAADELTPMQETAAWHGLATNTTAPVGERLAAALRALEGYEAEVVRLLARLAPVDAERERMARYWASVLPPEPGPEVVTVRDATGRTWHRHPTEAHNWRCKATDAWITLPFGSLARTRGPLTDVSPGRPQRELAPEPTAATEPASALAPAAEAPYVLGDQQLGTWPAAASRPNPFHLQRTLEPDDGPITKPASALEVGSAPMTAEEWNARYPVGTRVMFWPGGIGTGMDFLAKTRSPAWPLGDGTPLVSLEGISGGIALTHVQPITDAQETRDA